MKIFLAFALSMVVLLGLVSCRNNTPPKDDAIEPTYIFKSSTQEGDEYYADHKDDLLPIYESKSALEKVQGDLASYDWERTDKWHVEEYNKFAEIDKPVSVCSDHEYFYILDTGLKQILKYTFDGELIGRVGKIGNGPTEFLDPKIIKYFENKLYVLDAGNFRVQLFNLDLSFDGEMIFDDLKKLPYADFRDIQPSEDGIYVSFVSHNIGEIRKYIGNKSQTVLTNFCGTLAYDAESKQVIGINEMTAYLDKKENSIGYMSGLSRIISLSPEPHFLDKEKDEINLSSFVIDHGKVVGYSGTCRSLFVTELKDKKIVGWNDTFSFGDNDDYLLQEGVITTIEPGKKYLFLLVPEKQFYLLMV